MTNEELIIKRFKEVKALGWVKSNRKNNTGIGKTFEDYVGVVENNIDEPDLYGYEIKSHRTESNSYVTLFTKSPSFPKGANSILKEKYGSNYEDKPLKKLHTSMFANTFNTYDNRLSFKLINDKDNERIYIGIFTLVQKEIIDKSVYYSYDDIRKILKQKLKDLFYVSAKRKYENNNEYFYFSDAEIYSEPSFENFLQMLDNGDIMYDIRIGSYGSGKNYGKAHDHGSGFRIKEEKIKELYSKHKTIEQ